MRRLPSLFALLLLTPIGWAQIPRATAIEVLRVTKPVTGTTSNAVGFAYHPDFDQYHALDLGTTGEAYIYTSAGALLHTRAGVATAVGANTSSIWFNCNTRKLEIHTFNADTGPSAPDKGIFELELDASGFYTGNATQILDNPIDGARTSQNQPSYDPITDTLFYHELNFDEHAVNFAMHCDGYLIPHPSTVPFPGGVREDPNIFLDYRAAETATGGDFRRAQHAFAWTGVTGYEFAIEGLVGGNGTVTYFDWTGAWTGLTTTLTDRHSGDFLPTFANGLLWIYSTTGAAPNRWIGYDVFTTAIPACPEPAPTPALTSLKTVCDPGGGFGGGFLMHGNSPNNLHAMGAQVPRHTLLGTGNPGGSINFVAALDTPGDRFFYQTTDQNLHVMDRPTGTVIASYPLGFDMHYLAFDVAGNRLVGTRGGGGTGSSCCADFTIGWQFPNDLVSIDPGTGGVSVISSGHPGGSRNFTHALDQAAGHLTYVSGDGTLVTLDVNTGAVVSSVAGPAGIMALEWDSVAGRLVGLQRTGSAGSGGAFLIQGGGGTGNNLLEIDRATGGTTPLMAGLPEGMINVNCTFCAQTNALTYRDYDWYFVTIDMGALSIISRYRQPGRWIAIEADVGLPACVAGPPLAQQVYWIDNIFGIDGLRRSDLTGGPLEELAASGGSDPCDVDIDLARGHLYWVDAQGQSIQRCNLDGSCVEDIHTGLAMPLGVGLDLVADKLYWTDMTADHIRRSNLDGSTVEDLVTTGLSMPDGIDIDPIGGKMYWCDRGTNKVQRANLDGTEVEDLITGLNEPDDVKVDAAAGKIYWTDYQTQRIRRANLDGSGMEDLVVGLDNPRGIALDLPGCRMYWGDPWGNTMRRARLDGNDIEDVTATGLGEPLGVALDVSLTCCVTSPAWGDLASSNVSLIIDANASSLAPIQIDVEWSTSGGAGWTTATAAPGSPLANPAIGVPVPVVGGTFVWDSVADGVGLGGPQVALLRFTIDDGTLQAACRLELTLDTACLAPNCGDCDGNGFVNILDALIAARIDARLAAVPTPGSIQFNHCNVQGALFPDPGAVISVLDALTLARYVAGLIPLTCGPAPTCTVTTPAPATPAGNVDVDWRAIDGCSLPVDLVVSYSTDAGATWSPATEGPGSDGTVALSSGPTPGALHRYVWDSATDGVGMAGAQATLLRLEVSRGSIGSSCTTASFNVAKSVPTPTTWVQLFPTTSPSPRYGHQMVWDAGRQLVVLFGGLNGGYMNETWEWNGVNWNQRFPATSPPVRYRFGMAYDRVRGLTVAYGGHGGAPAYLSDTWEYDGNNWTERFPVTVPTARNSCRLVFDENLGVCVMFGGDSGGYRQDTWHWDGGNWVQQSPGTRPSTRSLHGMRYYPPSGKTFLYGGYRTSNPLGDTWEWDGITWSQHAPTSSPALMCPSVAVDRARGVVVQFGGSNTGGSSGCTNETWEWNGVDWTQMSPTTSPQVRFYHPMVYDEARGVIFLFGGSNPTQLNDTWIY